MQFAGRYSSEDTAVHLCQADPTILGYNLLNEPRCNCAPTVVDASTGYAAPGGDPNTDCANIKTCFTNVQVQGHWLACAAAAAVLALRVLLLQSLACMCCCFSVCTSCKTVHLHSRSIPRCRWPRDLAGAALRSVHGARLTSSAWCCGTGLGEGDGWLCEEHRAKPAAGCGR